MAADRISRKALAHGSPVTVPGEFPSAGRLKENHSLHRITLVLITIIAHKTKTAFCSAIDLANDVVRGATFAERKATFVILAWVASGLLVANSPHTFAQETTAAEALLGNRVIAAVKDKDLDSALQSLGDVVDREMTVKEAQLQRIPAAAAAVYRLLISRSSDQQYDSLMQWSLPSEDRKSVRILSVPVPVDAPPKEFARAMRQRPKDKAFAVADIAGMEGIFCSGWILVEAAEDIGRLSRLITKLQTLQQDGVPGADPLLNLAMIRSRRTDTGPLKAKLIQDASSGRPVHTLQDFTKVAVACAASTRKELGESGVAILASLDQKPSAVRSFLRTVRAMATQKHLSQEPPAALYDQAFQYWDPVTGGSAKHRDQGAPPAMWLTHEGHLLHAAGGIEDTFFFRYPLTGEFDFVVETQGGGDMGTDGGLVYGGLHFEAMGRQNQLSVSDADGQLVEQRFCPFIRHEPTAAFHRLSIRGNDSKIAMETNFHPMWTFDKASASSPWLGLRSRGQNRPVFRNAKLTGSPTIPRKVELISGDPLRGWLSDFFTDSPAKSWSVNDGVLIGHANSHQREGEAPAEPIHREGKTPAEQARQEPRSPIQTPTPSADFHWLRYERPLMKSETVTYQFKHSEGDAAIHPSVGRMVFLIRSGGVRVRWITNHASDWTGLAVDHALLEPLSRRGPKPLPLKDNQWNEISVTHTGDFIDLTLNGEQIYHRKLELKGDAQFGLYRRRDSAAEIRSVTLTGNWPEQVPPECLQNPFQLTMQDSAGGMTKTAHRLISEKTLQSNSMGFRRTLATLSNNERYARLGRWVFPPSSKPHSKEGKATNSPISGFRLSGFFMPTRASPHQLADPAFARWEGNRDAADPDLSPDHFSPASDWVRLALLLGKLDEIELSVKAFDPQGDHSLSWGKSAILCIIACQRRDQSNVDSLLDKLSKEEAFTPTISKEYLVASTVVRTFPDSRVVLDYVTKVQQRHAQNPDTWVDVAWKSHWMALAANIHRRHLDETDDAVRLDELPGKLIPTFVANAQTQGNGRSLPIWRCSRRGETHHVAGHNEDSLYFPSPLSGDYTIEADLVPWSSTVMTHLGDIIKPGTESHDLAKLGAKLKPTKLEPPIVQLGQWLRYRQELRGQQSTVFFNGRKVVQRQRRDDDDPWCAFQGWWKGMAALRDFSISGDPIIPQEVVLSASTDLIGWSPYFGVSYSPHLPNWTTEVVDQTNVIVGGRANLTAGCAAERLLQYHRPLAEDGQVKFEFYHREGQTTAAPALGRFVMRLQPSGVAEHWISDGRFDRTLVRPDQGSQIAEHQKHAGALPLKNDAWNHVQLSIAGDSLTLRLNETMIYQRDLPAQSDRTLGLFYFADQTNLQVRNVAMQGDWPKTLPSPPPFANPEIALLDKQRDQLPVVFHQPFNDSPRVAEYFEPPKRWMRGRWQGTPQGREVEVHSEGKWAGVSFSPRFSVQGDFDIEVGFKDLRIEGASQQAAAQLTIQLEDEFSRELIVSVGHMDDDRALLLGGISLTFQDDSKRYLNKRSTDESTSGKMRIVRRDQQASFLFAQGNSPIYRLLAQYDVSDAHVPLNEIQLGITHTGGIGESRVTWTSCTIRADSIKQMTGSQSEVKAIGILNLATNQTRIIARGTAKLPNLGSSEWSPDQKQITFDRNSNTTVDSRLVVVDIESGKETDVGFGSLPKYSPDGKQIAFSAARQGVGIMNADGTDRKIVDPAAWSIHWSPVANTLVYGKRNNLYLWDIAQQKSTPILTGPAATQYTWFHYNIRWSHDGRKIVFKGRRSDGTGDDVAVASLDQRDQIKVLGSADGLVVNFSWSPDDRSVLVGRHLGDSKRSEIWKWPVSGNGPKTLVPLPDVGGRVVSAMHSPDAKQLAMTLYLDPQLIPWTGKADDSIR